MKKQKCDGCGIKGFNFKIIGKPKHKMIEKELREKNTSFGDNKTFEKRYCGDCSK